MQLMDCWGGLDGKLGWYVTEKTLGVKSGAGVRIWTLSIKV